MTSRHGGVSHVATVARPACTMATRPAQAVAVRAVDRGVERLVAGRADDEAQGARRGAARALRGGDDPLRAGLRERVAEARLLAGDGAASRCCRRATSTAIRVAFAAATSIVSERPVRSGSPGPACAPSTEPSCSRWKRRDGRRVARRRRRVLRRGGAGGEEQREEGGGEGEAHVRSLSAAPARGEAAPLRAERLAGAASGGRGAAGRPRTTPAGSARSRRGSRRGRR